jgi:hypothetical protein
MRAFTVVLMFELFKSLLLFRQIVLGRVSGGFLQSSMHPFMTAVLFRMTR